MAEKRYKSFVVIGDDDAQTTREFFYIGSGENRSAEAMRQNALDYYEAKFPDTLFPEISNQRNYNKDPHEFNNLVQVAVSEGRAEHTRIPNFGDRWVITPKSEETPTKDGEEVTASSPGQPLSTSRPYAELTGQTLAADEDDRVGLPPDTDADYEPSEEEQMKHYKLMEEGYDPALIVEEELTGEPGDILDQIEEKFPANMGIAPAPIPDQDYPEALDYITPSQTPQGEFEHYAPVKAIGGFDVPGDNTADKKTDEQNNNDRAKLPTQEEMDEEARRLRENPATQEKGNTGDLRAVPMSYGEGRRYDHLTSGRL